MLIALAVVKLVFHVLTDGQYGYFRDELQLLADARHLEWGYVAYPPLTPFFAHLSLVLFGTSLRGFRFFAALSNSVAMVVAGLMAKRMGGGRSAQIIAAVATAIAPVSLATSALMEYVSFDFLWFVLAAYFVICLIEMNDERWWLGVGAALGLGLLTKYSVAFWVAGVVAAVFFTPLRAHLRGKWLWLGALVSIVIAAPNLIWQMQHQWISLDFLHHIHERDIGWGRTKAFLPEQLYIAANLFTVPLWMYGLYIAVREKRPLAWMFIVPFALFILAKGRGYYTAPLYPMLFAAGAAHLPARRWVTATASILLTLGAVTASMVTLPITPVHSKIWDFAVKVNGDFIEELGWPELTTEVARIYDSLPPEERPHTGIFCNNYGEAGAIDLYGPALGLPHPISGTNSFWLRGPGPTPPTTLIVLGDDREGVEGACQFVTLAGHTPNPYRVQNEEVRWHPDIFLCRGLKHPVEEMWPKLKRFG